MNRQDEPDFKFALYLFVLIVFVLVAANKCHAQTRQVAQYDTIAIKSELIVGFTKPKENGSKYAILRCNGIEELVSVSKSVASYIDLCKENNIKPSLALKLKNGRAYSIIRYSPLIITEDEKRRHCKDRR